MKAVDRAIRQPPHISERHSMFNVQCLVFDKCDLGNDIVEGTDKFRKFEFHGRNEAAVLKRERFGSH